MAQLTISLFGSIKVLLDGSSVDNFRYDKVRALLAYLATLPDRVHPRDALVGLLWPDLPNETALCNLRQALVNLRSVIGDRSAQPPFLVINRKSIAWNPHAPAWVDVTAFTGLINSTIQHAHRSPFHCKYCAEVLEKAIQIYQGAFLAHFFLPDSAPFEEWASLQRETYQRLAFNAFSTLINVHEQRGDYDRAVGYARRQLEIDPWREEIHRQIMRLLVLAGQRSAALAQYEECRRILVAELGLEPEPETTVLNEQISTHSAHSGLIAPERPRGHLPYQTTPFIGRERELAEINRLLADPTCRLITITGAGGFGKTRLALQVAAEVADAFPHGVHFIPLAGVSSPHMLADDIASNLEIPLTGEQDAEPQLLEFLREKDLLLVLDNFEHLIPQAQFVSKILTAASRVILLVTTRERLKLAGEWVYEIRGLQIPPEDGSQDFERYEAVQLFRQGARRVQAAHPPSDTDDHFIARICRLLDGNPLAIELASAWTRSLSPREIFQEIEADLRFLSASRRDLPDRHQSIQAIFDHSWRLLDAPEQAVFRRLAVFRGGFSREAADQVSQAKVQHLGSLLDKSLLRRNSEGRFDLHELTRQYAYWQLETSAEQDLARDRHLAYYLQFAESAQPELEGEQAAYWLNLLEGDHANLQAALQWSLESGDIHPGIRLAVSLYRFWYWRSHFAEGLSWLQALINAADRADPSAPPDLLGKALHAAGVLANERGSLDHAQHYFEESLALRRKLGDLSGQAVCLNSLGAIAFDRQDFRTAERLFLESLELRRKLGEKESLFVPLSNLGTLAHARGDYDLARSLFEESLQLQRELQNKASISNSLADLGWTVLCQGERSYAHALFTECLSLSREIGDADGIAYALEGIAGVFSAREASPQAATQAARLFGAAEALRETIGAPLSSPEQAQYAPSIRNLRGLLGEPAFGQAWKQGRQIMTSSPLEDALDDLLSG
jgi:predicted ATPase/DNA-binding SARP family transcriptional activator